MYGDKLIHSPERKHGTDIHTWRLLWHMYPVEGPSTISLDARRDPEKIAYLPQGPALEHQQRNDDGPPHCRPRVILKNRVYRPRYICKQRKTGVHSRRLKHPGYGHAFDPWRVVNSRYSVPAQSCMSCTVFHPSTQIIEIVYSSRNEYIN